MEQGIIEGFIAPYIAFVIIGAIVAYFCGAIPNAVIVSRRHGVDIRNVGSGNTGATNVARTLGAGPGALVMCLDAAKGALAVLIMMALLHVGERVIVSGFEGVTMMTYGWTYELALVIASICSMLGHVFSPFLGFHGGKGVSTAFGSALVVMPIPALLCFGIFLIMTFVTRYASVGSITTVLLLPLWIHVFYPNSTLFMLYGIAIAVLVLVGHRSNIVRLAHHEEKKFSFGHADGKKDS